MQGFSRRVVQYLVTGFFIKLKGILASNDWVVWNMARGGYFLDLRANFRRQGQQFPLSDSDSVRATADGGAGLAGDPKLNIFTEQLLQIAHLAGDPKRKG